MCSASCPYNALAGRVVKPHTPPGCEATHAPATRRSLKLPSGWFSRKPCASFSHHAARRSLLISHESLYGVSANSRYPIALVDRVLHQVRHADAYAIWNLRLRHYGDTRHVARLCECLTVSLTLSIVYRNVVYRSVIGRCACAAPRVYMRTCTVHVSPVGNV